MTKSLPSATRRRVEDAIETLIALLDSIEHDADLEDDDPEDGGDDEPSEEEPSLGSIATSPYESQENWAGGSADDREAAVDDGLCD